VKKSIGEGDGPVEEEEREVEEREELGSCVRWAFHTVPCEKLENAVGQNRFGSLLKIANEGDCR